MSLHTDIKEGIKEAMKAKEQTRLMTLRGLSSELTNEAVKNGDKPDTELSDEAVMSVIQRLVKQRRDSIEQYTNAGRSELAESEQAELAVLETFLPEQMSEDEIREVVKATLEETGVTEKSGIGQLMGALMPKVKGKADGSLVKKIVDELLA
jgi:uncharacterized protein YqeY